METVVRIKVNKITKKDKVKNIVPLWWYDNDLCVMKTFYGSSLKFEYKFDSDVNRHRLVPCPVIEEKEVITLDYEYGAIRSLVDDLDFSVYASYIDDEVSIYVNNKYLVNLCEKLDGVQIEYSI